MLKLNEPFFWGGNALPMLGVGGGCLTLDPLGCENDRIVWRWTVILPNGRSFSEADLKTSPMHTDDAEGTRQAFSSLLTFLGACAESYPDGENASLFPPEVAEWAQEHSDEIAVLACKIEEDQSCIEDEEDS